MDIHVGLRLILTLDYYRMTLKIFLLFRIPLRPLAHGRVRRAAGPNGSKVDMSYTKDVCVLNLQSVREP